MKPDGRRSTRSCTTSATDDRAVNNDFVDVYTKVAITGRVYEAGVARAWRGKGDPESEITRVLIEQAPLIQKGLQRLENRSFDQQAAADIVELHGHVTRAIIHRPLPSSWRRSCRSTCTSTALSCPSTTATPKPRSAARGLGSGWPDPGRLVRPARVDKGLPELRRRLRRPLPARLYRDTAHADCQRTRPLALAVGVSRTSASRPRPQRGSCP
jgi:hypothetical protein